VDYAIESEGHGDVTNIQFGRQVQLYIKVLFCRNVEVPIVGFLSKHWKEFEIFGTKHVSDGQETQARISGANLRI